MIEILRYLMVGLALTGTIVEGLKCFKCNSVMHPDKCRSNATLSELDTEFIVDCSGSCRISTIQATVHQAHLRSCGDQDVSGCVEKEFEGVGPGKLCHCSKNYCNMDWSQSMLGAVKDPVSLESSRNNAKRIDNRRLSLIIVVLSICLKQI